MKWLESILENAEGSNGRPLPGASADQIAKLADYALDGQTMIEFIRGFFISQKLFSEFIGVGESTVAGWVKSRSFPAYAKRAALGAYFARKHWRALRAAQRDAERPKVVRDGEHYLIVRFQKDDAGVWIGKILARDVPSEKAALLFASGIRAWELLAEAEEVVDQEIEGRDPEDTGWLIDLKAEIGLERARALAHEKMLEAERTRRAALAEVTATFDELLSEQSEDSSTADNTEKGPDNGEEQK